MKNLIELRAKISPIPSLFARDASDISSPEGRAGKMDFENGFSKDFASKESVGEYLQRNDFNRFGEIASREIHFKEAGGAHTYSQSVSDSLHGYPDNGVLVAFDGKMLTQVESQIQGNTVAFLDSNDNIIPHIIDCLVTVPSGAEKKVVWKTASRIYGIEEGLFSLSFDFTRISKLDNGSVIDEDALIIGTDDVLINGSLKRRSFFTSLTTPDGTFSETIASKGKSGDQYGYYPYPVLGDFPTFFSIAGSTNYFMSFFAKKGSTFTGRILEVENTKVTWYAIPVKPIIKENANDSI